MDQSADIWIFTAETVGKRLQHRACGTGKISHLTGLDCGKGDVEPLGALFIIPVDDGTVEGSLLHHGRHDGLIGSTDARYFGW